MSEAEFAHVAPFCDVVGQWFLTIYVGILGHSNLSFSFFRSGWCGDTPWTFKTQGRRRSGQQHAACACAVGHHAARTQRRPEEQRTPPVKTYACLPACLPALRPRPPAHPAENYHLLPRRRPSTQQVSRSMCRINSSSGKET